MTTPARHAGSTARRNRTWAGVLLFWLMAALAVPVWLTHDSSAWDLRVYGKAIDSLKAGHDPYIDATDAQKQHHARILANGGVATGEDPPYSYVYAPVTLPALRIVGHLQLRSVIVFYWLLYIAAALACIAVGVSLATPAERTWVLYAAGIACFFPGLLANGTVLGGNVAYILYGLVLSAAMLGWHKQIWSLFYAAVLLAACVKAPLLSLALIPALSARRQWRPAVGTIAAGLALFAMQPMLWPSLFRHYLEAVELQFSFNHDFGCSPAGLFSQALYHNGISYSPASYIFYMGYAIPLFAGLVYLSRHYLRSEFPLWRWIPVLLIGVVLLNPRILEYDVAPVTMMMALVAYRSLAVLPKPRVAITAFGGLLLLLNAASLYSWEWRKDLDGPLLTVLLIAGGWNLLRSSRRGEGHSIQGAPADAAALA